MSENTCVCCGEIIPEGTQVCPRCRSVRYGSKRTRVETGLECCQVSMGDDEPFGKCGVCPYRDDGINVEDCRAVLCREALEVIRDG